MPRKSYRKKKKTGYRKKYVKKNYSDKQKFDMLVRKLPLGGISAAKMIRLKFVDEISCDAPTGGGPLAYVYSANGMYDPRVAIGGGAPAMFNFWLNTLAPYSHYTVIASSICFTPLVTTTITGGVKLGVLLSSDGTSVAAIGNANDLIENKYNRWNRNIIINANSWANSSKVKHYFNAKRFFHKSAIVGSKDFTGTSAANPAEQAFFECWVASVAGSDPPAFQALVEIEYIAVLTEQRYDDQ